MMWTWHGDVLAMAMGRDGRGWEERKIGGECGLLVERIPPPCSR